MKKWGGLTLIKASNVWTDGENIYYSENNTATGNYVLDKATSTWSRKTWNGVSSFDGEKIWTDGDNIYYSNGSATQYVLDKSTSKWNRKTWTELTDFDGMHIWTDGENIYCSGRVLDRVATTTNIPRCSL